MPHHHPPQSQTLAQPEEEALKSNTDCIYFLASPFTCKKGAECEYRHSDIARLNPRDCYYWFSGNCLNPKCAFRHPPLEGMLGPQEAAPSGSSLPPSQTTATTVSSTQNSGKQSVPCIFFQKGFCLKGAMCHFSHGLALANISKAPQGPLPAAFPEPSTIKKPFAGPQKCSTEPKVVEAFMPPQPQAKLPSKTAPAKAVAIDYYTPNYRQTTPPFAQGDFIEDYHTLNSKDTDEISREPSPGFDVLVDDQLIESDYYQHEDHKDYDSMVDVEPDRYHNIHRDDDSYNQTRESYGRDQQRVSSERNDRIDGSDLRYRLSKNRKVNSLKSVISHDDLDRDGGDRSYRDTRVFSDRLRGRIKLPGGERERERTYSRGRVQDRIKGRVHKYSDEGRGGFRGSRKKEIYENNVTFVRPKSLSEIMGRKNNESIGKRKYPESYEEAQNDVSFEGPKPLSEILKRKRGKELGDDSSKAIDGQILEKYVSDVQVEKCLVADDDGDDREQEGAYVEGEGEYEYEQAEGEEDYIEDEAENDKKIENVDDGDDFAKKIGAVLS